MKDVRRFVDDLHHGLDVRKAEESAEALARIYDLARQRDAPADQLADITSGFPRIARSLVEPEPQRRRFGWRWREKRGEEDTVEEDVALPAGESRPELPPGPSS